MDNLALLVEDDPGLRVIFKSILARFGLDIIEASNGLEAIEQLQQHKPSILFLDMLMPQMSGKDVLDFMRSQPDMQHIYVVILSAHNGFMDLARDLPAGEFLLKPVVPAELRSAVERALKRSIQV